MMLFQRSYSTTIAASCVTARLCSFTAYGRMLPLPWCASRFSFESQTTTTPEATDIPSRKLSLSTSSLYSLSSNPSLPSIRVFDGVKQNPVQGSQNLMQHSPKPMAIIDHQRLTNPSFITNRFSSPITNSVVQNSIDKVIMTSKTSNKLQALSKRYVSNSSTPENLSIMKQLKRQKSHSIERVETPPSLQASKTAGIGLHNVVDRMIPTAQHDGIDGWFQHTANPRTVSIIGAPMTHGQPYVGTDSSPQLLRQGGLSSMLSSLGWRIEQLPDLEFQAAYWKNKQRQVQGEQHGATKTTTNDNGTNSNAFPPQLLAKNSIQVGTSCQLLATCVFEKLQMGRFPLILGGDHSIGIGSLAGILKHRPDTGVLWIDAHADLNTPDVTESGNMHGMPVGMNMEGLQTYGVLPGLEWLHGIESTYPRLPPDSIVYVGLRDVDMAERKRIRDLNIRAYTMTDIDHYGIGNVMDMALAHLTASDSNRPIHISYDIDAVDPMYAPATGTAVRGGLTYREALYVAEAAAACGNLASAEIVELNPSLSLPGTQGAENTIDLGLQLITSFMGKSII